MAKIIVLITLVFALLAGMVVALAAPDILYSASRSLAGEEFTPLPVDGKGFTCYVDLDSEVRSPFANPDECD